MHQRRVDPSAHLSPVSPTSCALRLAGSSNTCNCSSSSSSTSSSSSSSSPSFAPSSRAPRAPFSVNWTRNMHQTSAAFAIVISLALGVLFSLPSPVNAFQGNIRFQNNGYTGITVSFQPEIDYSIQGTLIVELQNIFKKASEMLSLATGGRAYFKQVNFLIPINWQGLTSLPHLTVKKTRTMTVDDGHLMVKKSEQAFTDNPMTIQLGGCGKPGLQIQLSTKFMTDASLGIEERSKILLSNWVKYRYGVFDEHGFLGDPMYPLYWKTPGAPEEQVERVTSCAAHSPDFAPVATIRTVNQTSSGAPCTLKTNPLTGLPERTDRNGECIALPDTSSNSDIVTSLLSHPTLPNVKYFCTETSHNDKAPNKQNILCEGQSISQVINRHADFQQHKDQPQQTPNSGVATFNTTPTFTLLQEKEPAVAFIFDVDAESLGRKKSIASALSRFSQSLTLTLKLVVLDMKNSTATHPESESEPVSWVLSSEMTKRVIWGKNPSPICLRCVIDFLYKSLADEDASHIVIITEGKLTDSYADLDHIASILNERNILLKLAIFPYTREDETRNHYSGVKYLVSKVDRASIHLISPSSLQAHSHLFDFTSDSSSSASHYSVYSNDHSGTLPTSLKLCDFFDSIFPSRNILLSRQIFHPSHFSYENTNNNNNNSISSSFNGPNGRGEINFKFNLDNSLAESNINLVAQFVSTDPAEDFESPTYGLIEPSGRTYSMNSRRVAKTDGYPAPLYDVRLQQAMTGNWTLKYSPQNATSTLVGVAYARVSGTKRFPISGKCIVSERNEQDASPPVLYVMVSQDSSQFVQNALVTVTLTNDLGKPLQEARDLPLFDDGLASPDITQGDGIYSRYLTETSRGGFYGILVRIRSNTSTVLHEGSTDEKGVECCGSTVPKTTRDTVTITHLERMLDCGFIHVEKPFIVEQFVERITDLQMYQVDTDNRRVTVSWTPPSLSFDRMELKFFRSNEWSKIRDDFDSSGAFVTQWASHLASSNHKDIREKSTHSFNVTDPSEGIYYAAIKVNTKGYVSISNVATFYMPIDPTYRMPVNDLRDVYTTPSTGSFQAFNTPLLWMICLATLMAAVILIICIICCCSSRKRKNPKDSHMNGGNSSSNRASNTNNVGKHKNAYTNAVNGALHSSLTIQTTMGSSDDLTHEKSTPSSHTALTGSHHMIHSHLNNHKNSSTHDLHASSDMHHHPQHHHHQGFNLPVDETTNSLSPIQYWSAGVLLGHYHDVKQARERNEPPPVMKIEQILPDTTFTNLNSQCVTNSGSSSTGSDNHTGESGSYDESGYHGLTSSNHTSDPWRYELAQPAVAQYYSHYSYPAGIYTHQQSGQQSQQQQQDQVIPVTSATYYDVNGGAINAMSMWQEHPYPISIAPPSESASESGDVRYTVPGQRRSTTVSQV